MDILQNRETVAQEVASIYRIWFSIIYSLYFQLSEHLERRLDKGGSASIQALRNGNDRIYLTPSW